MEDMLFYDRMQFAFTITFHYLFPQLTMELSLIIVYFKWKFLKTRIDHFNDAAKFSELTGGIIGQTLAMGSINAPTRATIKKDKIFI
jgi:cytochrome bd-type quinol oxidase subunit 1